MGKWLEGGAWMEGAGWRVLDGGRGVLAGRGLDGGCLDGGKCPEEGEAAGWRDGWNGNAFRLARFVSRVGSAVRDFLRFTGWTVPGGSVPVCGSVRGLPGNSSH